MTSKTTNIHVALFGNPNSGKTSIFNALTGAHQHVGNYPGITVEKREGHYQTPDGQSVNVLDLPGTYSLTSYSPEERIAQNELLAEKLDVVVAVVDSTTLNRSLVLLTQLIQLGANPVLCLNMSDEAEKAGQVIDVVLLEQLLGFPVVQTVGHKSKGVDHLKAAIIRAAQKPILENRLVLGERLDPAIKSIKEILVKTDLPLASLDWVATKLLVNDILFFDKVRTQGTLGEQAILKAQELKEKIESVTGEDIALYIMERYYGFVDGLLKQVIKKTPREDARAISDRIDAVLANRILGIPFFLVVMYAIFWITFALGEIPMGWIETGFNWLSFSISGFWPEQSDSPLRSMIVDGIIGGVGGVIIFLPNIILLFVCLAFLEDTGYMARAAFLMDQLMHRFGLHGKSFVPMMTGFGCSVPGIMATRTLEHEHDRLTTMLVLPLMSCGARLPIWMLLIPAFFPQNWRAPMLWSVYMVGIVLALVLALILRKSLLRGDDAPFVLELPPYRLPTTKGILTKMVERAWLYLRKAGTIILGISILMWFITSYPKTENFQIDAQIAAEKSKNPNSKVITEDEIERIKAAEGISNSLAGRLGHALETIFSPLGFDWKIGTAMIGAFAAKEVFVAQMGILYSLGENDKGAENLQKALRRDYSPLVGLSLILFLLIATPCMATVAITKRESGSWKWALLQFAGLTVIGYLVSFVVYQVGRMLG